MEMYTWITIIFIFIKCTFSHENGTDIYLDRSVRMVGGRLANIRQFPYHVSIIGDDIFLCGGSLITQEHVLTAAHCVLDENIKLNQHNIQILLNNTSLFKKDPHRISIKVKKIYVPRSFKGNKYWFKEGDIAVLKLRLNTFTQEKWTVKLPENNTSYVDETGIVTGNGARQLIFDNPDEPELPREITDGLLRFMIVKVLTNEDCKKGWDDQPVPQSLVCVQLRKNRSFCDGDSGGSLVVNNTVVGVLSLGSEKCEPDTPEIFTRVSEYLDFIDKAIRDEDDLDILTFHPNNRLIKYSYQYLGRII